MKQIRDLLLSRREFSDWNHVLHWSKDGTLYLNTTPDISVGTPRYKKEVNGHSRELFHVSSLPLDASVNKLEFENALANGMLNTQPTSFIRCCKPSLSNQHGSVVAALTNNGNLLVFHNQQLINNLDQPNRSLSQRTYHSFAWSPNGNFIAVGNECGEIIIYPVTTDIDSTDSSSILEDQPDTLKLTGDTESQAWVTQIYWNEFGMVAGFSDNSVYFIQLNDETERTNMILPPSRFKVFDLAIIDNYVVVTSCGHIHKIKIENNGSENNNIETVNIDPINEYNIIPLFLKREILLVSNNSCYNIKLDSELALLPDEIITPYLQKKFKKWNEIWNPYGKYETNMNIYGVALSPDKYSVAIVYNIRKIAFSYKIASEQHQNIAFFPLYNEWELTNGTYGLGWYQTYQIYGCLLPKIEDAEIQNDAIESIDKNQNLTDYLAEIMNSKTMSNILFQNLITKETPTISLFRKLILEYAKVHIDKITNTLDRVCIESIANILDSESPVPKMIEPFTVRSKFIDESFQLTKNTSKDEIIESQEGNEWRRCSLTLLPLLTTDVNVCPVTQKRFIDIKRDTFNEYGWLTRTLLEYFDKNSVYTGSKLVSK